MPELKTHAAVEPDKDGDEADIPLHFDSTMERGHPVTVVRDQAGHVVFPAYVPPETQSPTAMSPVSPQRPEQQIPPQASEGPRKAASDPPKLETNEKRPRMSTDKRFVTELSSSAKRHHSSFSPALKRAGTNVSQLQRALSIPYAYDDDDESSGSSSSSSDEGEPGALGGDGQPQKQKPKPKPRPSDQFRRFKVGNEHYRTKGKVSKKDGRLAISVKDTSNTGYLAKALGAAVKKVVPLKDDGEAEEAEGGQRPGTSRMSSATTALENLPCPKLNIVIMVIGSRGDAQPFLKVGKVLKEQYGHRVRIATHPAFREFVEKDSGLEFFSVGGDPAELMAFMVKNPGMIPTLETVKAGDIGRRRAAMAEMFGGFWRACINATDDEKDTQNLRMMGDKDPFVADAIIANPPSFAHIHCAEALGIPLHLMFTFPYTPTQAFPHPLASIKKSNVDPGYTNFMSYPLVEMMVWQGLGDLVNDFRVKTLGLDPVSTLWAPGATYRLHVPFTYMWSPGLIPKPEDWGAEIDVSGFVFLDLASTFKPPSELEKFLAAGDAPIYIGFGSIVVDDADRFTDMIFEAVKLAGVRALVSKGWGGLGCDNVPDNIFMLENTPHDWLFPKVRACVIHGGAGTTAIALKCGKPTMVVPFFGDQHFWGSMLERAKAGPEPVPYKHLTAEKLAEGIKYCLSDEAKKAAGELAKDIELEGDGAENACKSFHRHLTLHGKHSMRCSILEDRVAVWQTKKTKLRLSALAADAMVANGHTSWRKLRLIRHNEWNDFDGPGEPVTGFAGSLMSSITDVVSGVGGVPYRLAKSSNERKERKEKRKKARAERHKARKDKAAAKRDAGLNGSAHKEVVAGTQEGKREKMDGEKTANQPEAHEDAEPSEDREESPEVKDFASKDKQPPLQEGKADEEVAGAGATDGAEADDLDEVGSVTTAGTEATAEDNAAEEFATHVGKGVGKSAAALARAPVDLSLAVAQGFHNAPRLYGDDTVRRPVRVTGIQSGLKAARYEFVYGMYDGFTGLVRLPVRGARGGGGAKGFAKGLGMGVTGVLLKPMAAIVGPVGYTLKGVKKQVERSGQPVRYIRRARIAQGQREMGMLGEDEKKRKVRQVDEGWDVMRSLWEAVERKEKEKGLRRRLGPSWRKEVTEACESVEMATEALAAVKRGESLEDFVKHGRKSQDVREKAGAGRPSVDGRKSLDRKGRKSTERSRTSLEMTGRDLDDVTGKEKGKGKGKVKADAVARIDEDDESGHDDDGARGRQVGEGEGSPKGKERAADSAVGDKMPSIDRKASPVPGRIGKAVTMNGSV